MWGTIASAVIDLLGKRESRKSAKVRGRQKVAAIRAGADAQVEISRAEWENLSVRGLDDSWKDEFVVIVATGPLTIALLGALIDPLIVSLGGTYSLIATAERMMGIFTTAGVDYAVILGIAVCASLGVRWTR